MDCVKKRMIDEEQCYCAMKYREDCISGPTLFSCCVYNASSFDFIGYFVGCSPELFWGDRTIQTNLRYSTASQPSNK